MIGLSAFTQMMILKTSFVNIKKIQMYLKLNNSKEK